jgi:hypothetical protein
LNGNVELISAFLHEKFGILHQALKVVYTFCCHPEGSEARSFHVRLTPFTYVEMANCKPENEGCPAFHHSKA